MSPQKQPLLLSQTVMSTLALLPVLLLLCGGMGRVRAYPDGPPVGACGHMYPTGHKKDAKTSDPPYTLSVSTTTFATGDSVTLNLVATGDPTYPYYEGMFVQARLADCSSDQPIGTFTVLDDDEFLRVMNCNGGTATAVSHKTATHQTNTNFTWNAPSEYQGRIYFRATVVKNTATFWTNVFSPYLVSANESSQAPSDYCSVQSTVSSVPALTASLVFVVLVASFAVTCFL